MQVSILLSKLVVSRSNPRRVKPQREAHRRLVASIRAYGLLEPLVVRPDVEHPRHFKIIAGNRRLLALKEVHREDGPHGSNGESVSSGPAVLTSDDLSDGQLATTFSHRAIAVREALLGDTLARKRVLVLVLHEKVRSEALAIGHQANGTTLHADHAEGFTSPALTKLRERRKALDPFCDEHFVEDAEAYARLCKLTAKQLDQLIELLTVECLTAHLQRETKLVLLLAKELAVDVRKQWKPEAKWLAGYQKVQLSHLLSELQGPLYDASREKRKKSELVGVLASMFADAADGKVEDAKLAGRLNQWLPKNLRTDAEAES